VRLEIPDGASPEFAAAIDCVNSLGPQAARAVAVLVNAASAQDISCADVESLLRGEIEIEALLPRRPAQDKGRRPS
jgi:hypothetical protein